MAALRRIVANLLIVAFLVAIVVDGLPSLGLFHDRAKTALDPVLDASGLWQGSWGVFAPTVSRENKHVEVHVAFADGGRADWRSPRWRQLSAWEKLTHFREMGYCERLRQDQNQLLFPALLDYVARSERPQAVAADRAEARVEYHFSLTLPPIEGDRQVRPADEDHWMVDVLYEEPSP